MVEVNILIGSKVFSLYFFDEGKDMLVYLLSYESKDWLRVLDMLKYVFFWLEDKKVWFVCVVVN